MATYNLKALIDSETVKLFNQLKQKIVIVKMGKDGSTELAWVTFAPFEINVVSWEQIYGLYASYSETQGKARVLKSSYTLASEKQIYPFENGVFSVPQPDSTLGENTYEVSNKMQDYPCLVFGLAQDVVANGVSYEGNPINATKVLSNESATFTPHERIRIFMQSDIDDGMVISRIKSQSLDLDFTTQSDIAIKYDKAVGAFVKI
jgi:hypothetical protein